MWDIFSLIATRIYCIQSANLHAQSQLINLQRYIRVTTCKFGYSFFFTRCTLTRNHALNKTYHQRRFPSTGDTRRVFDSCSPLSWLRVRQIDELTKDLRTKTCLPIGVIVLQQTCPACYLTLYNTTVFQENDETLQSGSIHRYINLIYLQFFL